MMAVKPEDVMEFTRSMPLDYAETFDEDLRKIHASIA
jgi:hypothetical protein